jgi:hypothetical protein
VSFFSSMHLLPFLGSSRSIKLYFTAKRAK